MRIFTRILLLNLYFDFIHSYLLFVTEVLTSVQKTEESLRRLKKIRDRSTGILPSEPQGISDDEKIRIQLKVDVNGYVKMVRKLHICYIYFCRNISFLFLFMCLLD